MISSTARIHPTAEVENEVAIGDDTRIWHQAQVRTRAAIGKRCIVGKGVFIDFDVAIGDDCKFQNYACIYHGVSIGRGVFVGPHVVFTNDMRPRATGADFAPLRDGDWEVGSTVVEDGVAVGANSTILPNVRLGKWSMVAAGSVVSRDVAPYSLVIGAPAKHAAWLCPCGQKVDSLLCERCGPLPADHPLSSCPA